MRIRNWRGTRSELGCLYPGSQARGSQKYLLVSISQPPLVHAHSQVPLSGAERPPAPPPTSPGDDAHFIGRAFYSLVKPAKARETGRERRRAEVGLAPCHLSLLLLPVLPAPSRHGARFPRTGKRLSLLFLFSNAIKERERGRGREGRRKGGREEGAGERKTEAG